MTRQRVLLIAATMTLSFLSLACGGDREETSPSSSAAPSANEGTSSPSAQPAATGKTIEIKLISDDKGNYFQPSKVEAHQGDVLHFVLVSGAHNVDFLADSNPGKSGLPPASDVLQLPGQTLDIPVTFAPGHYYWQCDPHAALGMKGHLEVEKEKD